MKKLLEASFDFKTGENEYSNRRLLLVESTPHKTDLQDMEEGERVLKKWFSRVYQESELTHYLVLPPITENSTLPLILENDDMSTKHEDSYSADMAVHRIEQLVEETKPYTDRLVLNGWAPSETIQHFQDRLYYVNTFEDPDNKDQYTVIKW